MADSGPFVAPPAPSHGSRLPSLDGLRAVCILAVLFGHAAMATDGRITKYLFNGALGVEVFFVISGFLITRLLLVEMDQTGGVDLRAFYARRIVRLVPAQAAFILALWALSSLTRLHLRPCQYVTAITYTKNYACASWADAHFWSLSVEEQFYLLWAPLLAFVPRRWFVPLALATAAIAPVSRVLGYAIHAGRFAAIIPAAAVNEFSFTSNADALMCGALLAIWLRRRREEALKLLRYRPALGRAAAVALIYLILVVQVNFLFGILTVPFGQTIWALAAAYLVASYTEVRSGLGYRLLNSAPAVALGAISYSVYVWQQIFFSRPGTFGAWDWMITTFPQNLLLALAAGWASYLALERPFRALRRSLRAARPSRLEPATQGSLS